MRFRSKSWVPLVAAAVALGGAASASAATDPSVPPAGQPGWYPARDLAVGANDSFSVNVANGNLIASTVDLPAAASTYQVTLRRTYNSRALADTGLGKGWRFDADPTVRLAVTSSTVTGTFPDGAVITFTRRADGSFAAPDGSDWSLTTRAGGGYTAASASSGGSLRFDGSGGLVESVDDAGRSFTVQYTSGNGRTLLGSKGTQDGRRVNFSYDGVPRVRLADDPASNKRDYRYDAGGRLTEYQQGSAITRYTYDTASRLTRVELPDGTVGTVTYNSDGRVSAVESTRGGSTIDSFTVTYGPADAPCLSTDIGKSTVTNPGDGTTVSYCITADGRGIDRSADVDAPAVDSSGTLNQRFGDYVGDGFLDLKISATDEGSAGIASIKLVDGDGQPIGTPVNAPGCPSACPETFDATFHVNTANLGDGRREITAVATDAAGNTGDDAASSVYVDTVGPGLVTDIAEDEYDSDTGKSLVRWVTPNDPDLPDGSPGAGSASSKVRYKVGSGQFTDWKLADNEEVAVPANAGQSVTVEVRGRDERANEGSTASATYTADSSSQPAPSGQQSRALAERNEDCRIQIDAIRGHETDGTPARFFIPSRQAEFQLSLACDPAALGLNPSVEKVRIRLTVAEKTGDDERRQVGRPAELGSFTVRTSSGRLRPTQRLRTPGPYGAVSFNCLLDPAGLSGNHTYVLQGSFTYIKKNGDESKDFAVETTNAKDFKCPSANDRRNAELDGWKHLTGTYADGENGKTSPGTALGAALGDAPWYPKEIKSRSDAWQAHHVVPATEKNAGRLQRLLFRCQVHPNQSENGVWLRAVELRKTPAKGRRTYYSKLEEHDKEHDARLHLHAYHGDTFKDKTNAYIGFLEGEKRLGKFFGKIEERDDCTAAVREDVRDTLTNVGVLLGASDPSLPARSRRN